MNRRGFGWLPAWLPRPATVLLWVASRLGLLIGLSLLSGAGDGVIALIFGWAREVLAGASPFHDQGVAYPPLAMLFFALLGVGEGSAGGYGVRFVAAMLFADFAGVCLASRAEREGRRFAAPAYVLGTFSVGPILLLWRYDLLPALFHLAAGLFLVRGSRRLAWAMLGLGIAFKPYLAVVAPLFGLYEIRADLPSPPRRLIEAVAFVCFPSFLAAVAILPWSGLEFLSVYTFQASRGLQIESGPALLLGELARAGITSQETIFSAACLCWERTGPHAGLLGKVSNILTAGALLGVVASVRRNVTTDTVLIASCAVVLVTLLTYRVFSPQYLLWALAPLSLVEKTPRGAGAAGLVAAAALVAAYLYPLHYAEVVNFTGGGRWLLLARFTVLLAAATLLVRSLGRTGQTGRPDAEPSLTISP